MSVLPRAELRALIEAHNDWCVSIFMPTHRVGTETQEDRIRLKNLLNQAEQELLATGMRAPEARQLLAPGQLLLQDDYFWRYQSDGLALFLGDEQFVHYRLPHHFDPLAVVSERFHIKPLLPILSADGRFFVLALSQGQVRLLQGTRYSVSDVYLDTVPTSLAEALRWDDPERQLQFHSGTVTPAGKGQRPAIFHGHGVGVNDTKVAILRYFHKLESGLQELLRDEQAPLVLAGVDYLLPIYRDANTYPHLTSAAIVGNPEQLSAEHLRQQAWAIVEPLFREAREEAAAHYRALGGAGSELASSELREVVPAAYVGRIETLFVALGLQRWGSFDAKANAVTLHDEPEPGDADLLDLAAVYSLLNGGAVYAVAPEAVPAQVPLAAVLRY